MRISHIIYRLPESTFLQIINFIGCTVTATSFLAVGIYNLPIFARNLLPLFIQDIKFSYCRYICSVERRQTFQTEITSLSSGYFYLLPTVTLIKAAGSYRCLIRQFQVLSFFPMSLGNRYPKHIQNRFIQTGNRCLPWSFQIKNNNLIHSLLKPASRHIECLLGTDFPKTSHRMTVYPYHTFSPRFHIEESIRHLVQGKGSTVIGRHRLVVFLYPAESRRIHILIILVSHKVIVYREVIDSPVLQCFYIFAIDEFHLFGNTLTVVDRLIEIHTSHRFYQQVKLCACFQSGQNHFLLTGTAVETRQQFTVGKDLCPVMLFRNSQYCSRFHFLRQASAVKNGSPALIEFLHRFDIFGLFRCREIVD